MADVLVNPLPNPLANWSKTHKFISQFIQNFPLTANLLDRVQGDSLTLSRASSKTFIPDSGSVTTVTTNNAAFTGSGILIEPSHTNLLTYSQQFDNAAWIKSGMSITANTGETTDPLGGNTADKWIAVTNNAANNINQAISATASSNYYASVFLKAGNVDYAYITTNDNTGSNAAGLRVDLANGTITAEITIGAMSVSDSGVVSVGNGWYYFWYETATTTGITTLTQYIYGDNADGSPTRTLTGEYIYLWQADLVKASYHLSPVPTTTAAATSLKDDYVMDLSNIPANDFYIEFDWTPISAPVNGDYILSLTTTGANGMEIYISTGFIEWAFNTIGEGGAISGTPSAGTTYTIRLTKTSASGVEFSMTGFTTDTDATATSDITWPAEGNIGSRYTDANHSHSVIANLKVGNA